METIDKTLTGDEYAKALTLDIIKNIADRDACIAVARCYGYNMEVCCEEYTIPQTRYRIGCKGITAQRDSWHLMLPDEGFSGVSLHNLLTSYRQDYTEWNAWNIAISESLIRDPIFRDKDAYHLLHSLVDEGFNVDISNDCGIYRVMPYGTVPINEAVEITSDDFNTAIVRAWLLFRHFKAIGWTPE